MKRELALEFSRVTEAAALACYNHIGRGDKNKADDAAVSAMRHMLNKIEIDGEIVIGEGQIDDAPQLYLGEKVGWGNDKVDIAVDPIDGTRMVSLGQENAVAVIVISEKDQLFKAPDMYMKKIMVSKDAVGVIDIELDLLSNVHSVAKKLNKDLSEMTVMTLHKPRHLKDIELLQRHSVKVIAIADGDVAGSVLVALANSGIDMFYGIGGAPEGVISGAIIRSLDGDMQAKLMLRCDVKENNEENIKAQNWEEKMCKELGIDTNKVLMLNDLVRSDNVIISLTGITDGTLVSGCKYYGEYADTQTLLIRGKSGTYRKITTTHVLAKKRSL